MWLIRMSVAPWHGLFPRITILEVNSGISKMLLSQFYICVQRFCVREWSLIMAQTGAEEILLGYENFFDPLVGV